MTIRPEDLYPPESDEAGSPSWGNVDMPDEEPPPWFREFVQRWREEQTGTEDDEEGA